MINEEVVQCEEVEIVVVIWENHFGDTERGAINISSEGRVTVVDICYHMDDGGHFTIFNSKQDTIALSLNAPSENRVEFRIKNSSVVNDNNCKACQEYIRDTLLVDVLPKEDFYTFSPNPTKNGVWVGARAGNPIKEKVFHLHAMDGRFLRSYSVSSDNNWIDLSGLPPGVYALEEQEGNCVNTMYRIVKGR